MDLLGKRDISSWDSNGGHHNQRLQGPAEHRHADFPYRRYTETAPLLWRHAGNSEFIDSRILSGLIGCARKELIQDCSFQRGPYILKFEEK